MKERSLMKPADQMARVTRHELGERLDEILEIADRDDVGFVITDEGKDDMVLCPARWFELTFDDNFGCIVNCAVRYAIGRETYMPSAVIGFVRDNMGFMDGKTINVMIKDIEREAENECLFHRNEWLRLRDELEVHISESPATGEHDFE